MEEKSVSLFHDYIRKELEYYHLTETPGDVRYLEGEFNQLDKRLGEISKRIDDQWKAVRLWLMIVGIVLGGLNIVLLIATLI